MIYFAGMLEKLRQDQTHYNYNGILLHIEDKFKIGKYTLPNWLRPRLRYLNKEIKDLTEADMKNIWNKYQELKK